MTLTVTQLRALRWLDENPSYESEWLSDGKPVKRQPVEKWNQFKVSGPTGSIIIAPEDMKALKSYLAIMATPDKMYSPNANGRIALKTGVDA